MVRPGKSKHALIYEHVHNCILNGKYAVGEQIPTEAELAAEFDASRMTVARALRDLEQQGFLKRVRGAGSFVRQHESSTGQMLGLISPLNPGVIGIMTDEVARVSQDLGYAVLLGRWPDSSPEDILQYARELSEQYIERKVAGVFFVPLLVPEERMPVNIGVAEAFDKAGIAVVLIDRDICDYPQRSKFDLVGVDNFQAGFILTEHLLKLGYRRIHFISVAEMASTATARVGGYRHALQARGITPEPAWIHRPVPTDPEFVRTLVQRHEAEAFVCANDHEAARLIRLLVSIGVRVPQDVAIVGMNDDPVAALLDVPLTTLKQPAKHIGSAAVKLMQQRLASPRSAAREVRVECELIVRESCGAALRTPAGV